MSEKRDVASPLVTLLTDFGLDDGYVAAMKGVLATLAPQARVVDVSHAIPPQDLLRAGLVWSTAAPYFPAGTIHVAVVDPGVGSRRAILAVETSSAFFLAPDNGLIGYVVKRREARRVVRVRPRGLALPKVSNTFHGRDIFAPAAARLAGGSPLSALGEKTTDYLRSELPRPRRRRVGKGKAARVRESGEVMYVDHFGNAVTNLRLQKGERLEELSCGGVRLERVVGSYSAVSPGVPLLLENSSGYLEIAVNRGHAARDFGLVVGQKAVATWRK